MTSPEHSQSQESSIEEEINKKDEKILAELGLSQSEIHALENPDTSGSTALVSYIDRGDKRMVVKRGINVDPDLNARREYAFLRLLRMRQGDKVAPDPYYYKAEPEGDILIMERIEGQPAVEMSNDDISKIALILAQVHKPEFKKPGIPFHERAEASQYDRLIEQVDFLRGWFDELGHYINDVNEEGRFDLGQLSEAKESILEQAVQARVAFENHSFSLIHYDLNPGNILKDEQGKILLLDWRQASIGDRAMDISKFFFKNNLNKQQQELFLQTYSSELADETLKERINVYSPLLRLGSLLWRLRFLNIDIKEHPEIAQDVDVNLVRSRLDDDYKYLIDLAEANHNK